MRRALILAFAVTGGFLISACSSSPDESGRVSRMSMNDVVNKTWEWAGTLMGESRVLSSVPDKRNYTLTFREDKTFSGQADCNFFGGTYVQNGSNLTLSMGPSTLAECGEDSRDDEFLTLLNNIVSFGERNENLILVSAENTGEMIFEEGGEGSLDVVIPQGLFNITWMWRDLKRGENGGRIFVEDVGAYSLTFRENGAVNIKSDCNQADGSYVIEGDQIRIDLGTGFMSSCGPDSRTEEFLELISTENRYRLQFNELFLDLENNRGTMGFISS